AGASADLAAASQPAEARPQRRGTRGVRTPDEAPPGCRARCMHPTTERKTWRPGVRRSAALTRVAALAERLAGSASALARHPQARRQDLAGERGPEVEAAGVGLHPVAVLVEG